jgi:peptidoglycan/xylan/chitin deacetylase (PgdA/CDA1 family)
MLMFHNVGNPPETEHLPDHMKVSERKLKRLLRLLRRGGYRMVTVGQMVDAFDQGDALNGAVALTFDDGYRDNHDILLPILKEFDATATVYVQTGPTKGHLNWLHHLFWMLHRIGPQELGTMLAAHVARPHLQTDLRDLPTGVEAGEYELKRLLKYEVSSEERDRILAAIFVEAGGDERQLAAQLYMGPDECRALDAAGLEVGAHTVNHLILSTLEPNKQRLEIEGSLRDLQSWLGHEIPSFAYPYGRTWDYDVDTQSILRDLGFKSAVTSMPGTNDPATPRFELRRLAMCEQTSLAEVMCELDGVFAWFARRGVDLRV